MCVHDKEAKLFDKLIDQSFFLYLRVKDYSQYDNLAFKA